MRRLLRISGACLAALAVAAALGSLTIYVRSNARLHRHYPLATVPAAVPSDAGAIERGRHLALTRGCLHCHGEDLGGATVVDNNLIGKIAGTNLTRGRGGLPPNFGNEDWVRAIRHGIHHDGTPLILMPSAEFAHLSDADFGDLLSFLASAPKVDRETVRARLGPLGRLLLVTGKFPLAAEQIDHSNVRPANVTPGITVDYGRYLATACIGCHGPQYAGGKIPAGPPAWPPSSNLTTIADGPLANWTEADFIDTLRSGWRPNRTELNAAMPRTFGQMSDEELRAIWIFLRSLPPVPGGSRAKASPPAASS